MLIDFESYGNTGESNTYWLSIGMNHYADVAGWPSRFIIYMAGAGRPGTGESITSSFDVFAGDATLLDMINGSK